MSHDHDDHAGRRQPLALGDDMSDAFLTHGLTPANLGVLPQPEGFAQPKADGSCHDTIELYLRVHDDVVTDARYMTDGCLHTVACGSALTTLLKGKTVQDACQLEPADIAQELDGLDEPHWHCAELAIKTLQLALQDYFANKRAPWRGLYGKK